MKKYLLIALVLAFGAHAARSQSGVTGGGSTVLFAGAPSGACSPVQMAVDSTTGNTYSCNGGAWLLVGPGTGSISAGTTNILTKYTSPTTLGNSLLSDSGSILSYAGTGGIASTSDAVHPGNINMVGNTTVVAPTANTFNLMGPSTPSFTAYGLQFSATGPSAAGVLHHGAPSSSVSQVSYGLVAAVDLSAQYTKLRCEPGLGDGLNAIPAGTYLQSTCYNDSGVTWTITGVKCFSDAGTPTLNATNGSGTGLLTGAITCTTAFAAGTQSGTTTIASGDFIKFTYVSAGVATQTTWVVSITQ